MRSPFQVTKTRTPAECERSGASNFKEWKLELRWRVAIGWHVAVDFETDADFNQNGCCPSHGVLLGAREIVEPKEYRTACGRTSLWRPERHEGGVL